MFTRLCSVSSARISRSRSIVVSFERISASSSGVGSFGGASRVTSPIVHIWKVRIMNWRSSKRCRFSESGSPSKNQSDIAFVCDSSEYPGV